MNTEHCLTRHLTVNSVAPLISLLIHPSIILYIDCGFLSDPSFSPKQKEHKTWKGKMVQTLRRYGSGTAPVGSDSVSSEEYTGALGVPLELCSSSFANEVRTETNLQK